MLPQLNILKSAQFTRSDVLELTELTSAQLKNTIDRDLVRLDQGHNPGTGRRRLFTGRDVLKLTVAHSMSGVGFPMGFFDSIAFHIEMRAVNRLNMLFLGHDETEKNFGIVTYPIEDGDWACIPFHDDLDPPKDIPPCIQIIFVDRLIDRVLQKLQALIADDPIPTFEDYRPKPPVNEYAPSSNFFKMWEKDDCDRWVYVGLNHEETQELLKFKGIAIVGDELEYGKPDEGSLESGRESELEDRHERARLKRLGKEWSDADE